MIKRLVALAAFMALGCFNTYADEGMWLPNLIGERIQDMKAKGFKLEASDIYDINNASMKDAIIMYGRGCTGELISPEGLMVTNHHCGYGEIQRHSTVENNYLANGFWAMDRSEELPNPGLIVTFLVRMEDVTADVLAGTDGLPDGPVRDSLIKVNTAKVRQKAIEGTHYKAAVEKFYYGNQYYLFVNEVYEDVRLVGAPPSAIGKYGGEADNWMWPRHTGDFALFRIYAGPDNKPAPYSKDNVPYVPKKYFPVSTKGVSEGDFTMVYGFPGTTRQFITSDAVDYVLNYSNPAKIALRTARLDIIKEAWKDDPAVKIAYAAKHSGIANAWKKWQGESIGLERLGTIAKKKALEEAFEAWAVGKPEYEGITREMHRIYGEMLPYSYAREYYNESLRVSELMTLAANLLSPSVVPGEKLPLTVENLYKDYRKEIDIALTSTLFDAYYNEFEGDFLPPSLRDRGGHKFTPAVFIGHLFNETEINDIEKVRSALETKEGWEEFLAKDTAMVLYRDFNNFYSKNIAAPYNDYSRQLDILYRTWVRGLIAYEESQGEASDLFPDANLTLRVAYGKVGGYQPEDAVWHHHLSTVKGILGKYRTGNSDYDLPENVLELFDGGDYGRWTVDGTVPVNFLASNHTTGGNSGSPVINADGELVGLNFDRTWLSTMSDIEFDPVMCRNISIDVRYMLFIIDKLGGASYLFDEMDLR